MSASAKIYVGNLSWNTNDETLRQAFSSFGNIVDSIVMRDRETNRSRGFGFVTYSDQAEAEHAIDKMNDTELDGRRIRVNIANARGSGGGGGNGGGGYGGGGQTASYVAPGSFGQSGYNVPVPVYTGGMQPQQGGMQPQQGGYSGVYPTNYQQGGGGGYQQGGGGGYPQAYTYQQGGGF